MADDAILVVLLRAARRACLIGLEIRIGQRLDLRRRFRQTP